MTHKICPDCGASLDLNESCNCKNAEAFEAEPAPLITVRQLPIIEEQLRSVKDAFIRQTDDALSLVCTEETLAAVKRRRAAITRVFNDIEERRKEVKKAILQPYEDFEKVYRECVTDIYKPCDQKLAAKIGEVENGLKSEKRSEAESYFNELCQSRGIDFLTFDRIGISVTLSVSAKKLREQIQAFVDRVSDELKLISTQTYSDEIFVEYKKSLNVANAVTTVSERHLAIERERQRKEALAEEEKRRAEAESRVNEAVKETETEAFAPPTEAPAEMATDSVEKLYSVTFTVCGTKARIKALKAFLEENKYDYK